MLLVLMYGMEKDISLSIEQIELLNNAAAAGECVLLFRCIYTKTFQIQISQTVINLQ